MTREEMLDFVQKVLEAVPVQHSVATLTEERSASVRFGRNAITQNMDTFRRELSLVIGDGSRKTSYHSHRIDVAAIPDIVKTAVALLETSSPDPEYMPPADAGQVYSAIDAWDAETAGVDAASRISAASAAIASAVATGVEAAGISNMQSDKTALATSTGNLCYHEQTEGIFQLTIHAGSGSSYRSVVSKAWRDIHVRRTVDEVIAEAVAAREPADSMPGEIDVVLEPQAVADILQYMLMSLNARTSDEGITVFAGREGRKVTSDRFTLSSVLGGPAPGKPFDDDGLACEDQVWIDKGVLRTMLCDRYWAQKTGRKPVAMPDCFYLDGGEGTPDDLAAKTDRCIRIRRFWYIRFVDQKSLELTGMTRDGVFLCEKGVVRPVKDFRWNWKPLDLFSKIEAMGTPERKGFMVVPPVLLKSVRI